ncbi:MAG: hypothetical protein VW405_01080 [Rhodospirillaceae bacterium]
MTILLPMALNAVVALRFAWTRQWVDVLYWTAALVLNTALFLKR